MAHVHLENVSKSYGALSVLHGVSLDIANGEFIILVGPSGCGKSTLLRLIAGLEAITGGEVSIRDRVVNDIRPKDRNIAMVFQSYALYPHKTVAKNMGFALQLAGRPTAEIDAKVNAAAEILNLVPLLDRFPKQLSGGQRQRVAMGRAIVRDPEVFLFDEPLSNLDAKLRVQMRAEIKSLHHRLKTTTIYVTHDQVEAMTMADRIVVMNAGRIEQVGRPLDLYDNPKNLFVAGFLGSPAMNFFNGRVEGRFFRTNGGATLELPPSLAQAGDGRELVAGIRPEHIALAGGASGLATTVVVDEPTGAETMIALDLAGDTLLATFRDRLTVHSGDQMTIHFPPGRIHLFDKRSGDRLTVEEHPLD
ncbi:sn-glycerol-3-phosphate ABC transporter ATP-binding protein UgpC [Rhizobium leguminosarum bv. viciae]|uniref:sn-glycerol-3-phosphate ABC transporter ATP-binding protein UgpC n=1 Tax=Rhizobium leguminosarum bv. viciae TaxID=387 RepID=A0A8I2GKV7_RHILV|nr:sn-glycerol-3-phosphate ABC transporter ATP-binding protein UgpC [Rhizobium leguminosarum]MBY5791626.1 sn-glycerol-3-phosphate ABC transporter ATP-binding protein UgpC [Rhizobium leguminosarum]NKM43578.1 sn-glycerol-3-phosphate ABC transporter ATP-binding protein UgpC [Rhizobium leguminosarum bv. viciae]